MTKDENMIFLKPLKTNALTHLLLNGKLIEPRSATYFAA